MGRGWGERLARRVWNRLDTGTTQRRQVVLDAYVKSTPSAENAVEIFHGQWSSKLPAPYQNLSAGQSELFNDARLIWAFDVLGSVAGTRVLELGPLEGGHSYMLDRAGARSVYAVESNTRAYLRCLVAKELLGMPSVHFECGDFRAYLRSTTDQYDLCLASGVLYHMEQPVELLADIARVAKRLLLWTHYYDEALLRANARTSHRITAPLAAEHRGCAHQLFRHEYLGALDSAAFCGGDRPFAYWMTRDGIVGALRHFGFQRIEIGCEQHDHPNGPAMTIVAFK